MKQIILNYEFIERAVFYLLMLNGSFCKSFLKREYSKQEAETKASDEVNLSIKRYGARNVNYNGNLTP